ncbi:MAG: site-specific integrase [Candidatus Thermoplasmatota archaeon]
MALLRLRPLYGYLSEAEARRMLDPRVPADPETRLILNLTLRCGMAGHEITWMRRGDVDLERGVLLARDARGRPHHEVVLHPEAVKALRAYLNRFPGDYLFERRTDPRSRPAAFYTSRRKVLRKRVRRRARQVGVRTNVCLMVLRHTYALAALRAGANPLNVARQLGYGSMRMMTIYLNELARDTTWDVRRHPVRY